MGLAYRNALYKSYDGKQVQSFLARIGVDLYETSFLGSVITARSYGHLNGGDFRQYGIHNNLDFAVDLDSTYDIQDRAHSFHPVDIQTAEQLHDMPYSLEEGGPLMMCLVRQYTQGV